MFYCATVKQSLNFMLLMKALLFKFLFIPILLMLHGIFIKQAKKTTHFSQTGGKIKVNNFSVEMRVL